jgi:hypothetical protein
MSSNSLPSCVKKAGIFKVTSPSQPKPRLALVPFRCGRSDCPVCAKIKKSRLLKRLMLAEFPKVVYMWTVTTDPKTIDPTEALKTIAVRWHNVLRSLSRIYPDLKYFKVIEFTKSGLPHIHIMFNQYVDWNLFRTILVRHYFGQVLHYLPVERNRCFHYLAKYLTKTFETFGYLSANRIRPWSASLHLLPSLTYYTEGTEFQLLWIGKPSPTLNAILEQFTLEILSIYPP